VTILCPSANQDIESAAAIVEILSLTRRFLLKSQKSILKPPEVVV